MTWTLQPFGFSLARLTVSQFRVYSGSNGHDAMRWPHQVFKGGRGLSTRFGKEIWEDESKMQLLERGWCIRGRKVWQGWGLPSVE